MLIELIRRCKGEHHGESLYSDSAGLYTDLGTVSQAASMEAIMAFVHNVRRVYRMCRQTSLCEHSP